VFWKVFLLHWLTMVLAFVCTGLYLYIAKHIPPPAEVMPWGLLVPILSGAAVALPAAFLVAWYLSKPLRHLTMA